MTTPHESQGTPWARAFLGVGSSLEPEENVTAVMGLLLGTPGVRITGISTFYWTPPLPAPGAPAESVAHDPEFLNGVVEIRTTLSPEELSEAMGAMETALGRVRSGDKYAPRTLDLDLLVFDPVPESEERPPGGPPGKGTPGGPEAILEARKVRDTSPFPAHPDIRTRPWVALPLLELAPALCLPPDGIPLADVARQFPDAGGRINDALTQDLRRKFTPATTRP